MIDCMGARIWSIWALLLSTFFASCTTCYHERFCHELVGRRDTDIIFLLGAPTHEYSKGNTKVLEWSYDGTYTQVTEEPGEFKEWHDKKGRHHVSFVPPHSKEELVPRVAILRFNFIRGRAVSYSSHFEGRRMCNYFIPEHYIARYKQEDKNRR